MWLYLDKQPPEIENLLLLTAACPNQEFKSEITIMVSQYFYTIHQWSKCTIVGPNEVVLLVQIVQMNQAEYDSFAQFVPTPDIPPPKNYQDIYFYIECDSSIGSRAHKNQGILFIYSYTKKSWGGCWQFFVWIFMFKFISELVLQQTTCNSCGKVNLTIECEISRAISSNMWSYFRRW